MYEEETHMVLGALRKRAVVRNWLTHHNENEQELPNALHEGTRSTIYVLGRAPGLDYPGIVSCIFIYQWDLVPAALLQRL
jgi:hypothetical protein